MEGWGWQRDGQEAFQVVHNKIVYNVIHKDQNEFQRKEREIRGGREGKSQIKKGNSMGGGGDHPGRPRKVRDQGGIC